MSPELFHHVVLNAAIFVLSGVRYFWGPPTDMLRLGLFLTVGFSVIGDMDYYYQWPLHLPTFGLGDRENITKMLLITTFFVDLGKDYYFYRFRKRLSAIQDFVR